jgi:Cof subfamily protein (haloacid dehalogenase superfamily)
MQIKMIVTDLDRTLLRTDKTISAYTAEVLNRCRERGIKIVFATARPKRTVESFAAIAGEAVDALILHNGAVVYIGGALHTCFGIEPKVRDKILLSVSRDFPEVALSVEIDDTLYANFDVSEIWEETTAVRTDFTKLPVKPADKIIIGSPEPFDAALFAQYIPADLYIETSSSEQMNVELIMNSNATKWEAVKIVAEYFKIQTEEIAAFGDDYNDISMLKNCGAGVAVSNSINEAKAAADYICDSNDNDGVAKWIEENAKNA